MDAKLKISILVGIQVALILTSFLSISIIESQRTTIGKSIDVAGKNRLLTSNVMIEIQANAFILHDKSSLESIEKLKENIYFLKSGGTLAMGDINPLPTQFLGQWNSIDKKYTEYEKLALDIMQIQDTEQFTIAYLDELNEKRLELIDESNALVRELAIFQDKITELLVELQIILLIVNVFAHIILIWFIFRILRKETEERIRTEKFSTIGKMAASLAHDIRNPISVIKGSFDLMKLKKKDQLDEFEKTQYSKIENSLSRITHQIKDVLNYVAERPVRKTKFSIKSLLKETIQIMDITDRVEKISDEDIEIVGDKEQIGVVLTNILYNSIQAMPETGKIKIRFRNTEKSSMIEIEDSGKGIPEKLLPHIFEPLVSDKTEGTGLGLSSCKRIIDAHGGSISAKNNPTTFSIELPLK